MIEIIISLMIMAFVMLMGVSVFSTLTNVRSSRVEEKEFALNYAKDDMENLKSLPFDTINTYAGETKDSEYGITFTKNRAVTSVSNSGEGSMGIYKEVTITVSWTSPGLQTSSSVVLKRLFFYRLVLRA